MTYRILAAAALAVALAAPALAQTAEPTYTTNTNCTRDGNSSSCTSETKAQQPQRNCGYLPNFGINRPCPNMQ